MRTNVTARQLLLVISMIAAICAAPALLAADRLVDKDVKALLDRVNHERDRFEDQLDEQDQAQRPARSPRRSRRRTVLGRPAGQPRPAEGPFHVRTTPPAPRSRRCCARRPTSIASWRPRRPISTAPASGTGCLRVSGTLATAYGTKMPMPDGDVARRLNDREVKKVVEELAKSADRYKAWDISRRRCGRIRPSTRRQSRGRRRRSGRAPKHDANKLASVVDDGRPASGEAQAVLERASRVSAAASGFALSPAAQASWREVETGLDTVAKAFSLTSVGPS